jgi:glycosyltransferase involved in cell wall biosynthesis
MAQHLPRNRPDQRGKVLLIAPQPFFATRGTPLNVLELVRALCGNGYKVDLLAYPFGTEVNIPGLRIIRSMRLPGITSVPIGPSWRKIFLDCFLAPHALGLALFNRYDVIHGIEEGGFVAAFIAKLSGAKCIFDMDSHMADQLRTSGFVKAHGLLSAVSWLESTSMRSSDAIISVCRDLSRTANELAPGTPVFQIEDIPPEGTAEADPALVTELRATLALEGKVTAVYAGNLEGYQGLDLLLRSYASYLSGRSRNEQRLLIVGGTPEQIGGYRKECGELGIAENVIFVGEQNPAVIGSYLALGDLVVSPRISGTNTPMKIYSYMASGVPILATNILSHTQVLNDENAFLTDATEAAMASALALALDNSEISKARREQKAAEAKRLIVTEFNRARFAEKLIAAYEHVLRNTVELQGVDEAESAARLR